MNSKNIISINSISGGGKTSLANALGKKLNFSNVFHFDDFDETNVYPDDFVAWWKRGADVEEFDFPEMDEAVRACLENGAEQTIVLDYPFGRLHHRFKDIITTSIYIDTPLDVALSRRILRDHLACDKASVKESYRLKAELSSYLSCTREVYLDSTRRYHDEADWVLDGTRDLELLAQQILSKL